MFFFNKMSSEQLYINVRDSVTRASKSEYKDPTSLIDELTNAKFSLTREDSQVVTNLIDILKKFDDNKGLAVELIKTLVIVVESIDGRGRGSFKKEEASKLFSSIIVLLGVSQRDRKVYLAMFDNTVELIFWGRDWVDKGGWTRLKERLYNIFSCSS